MSNKDTNNVYTDLTVNTVVHKNGWFAYSFIGPQVFHQVACAWMPEGMNVLEGQLYALVQALRFLPATGRHHMASFAQKHGRNVHIAVNTTHAQMVKTLDDFIHVPEQLDPLMGPGLFKLFTNTVTDLDAICRGNLVDSNFKPMAQTFAWAANTMRLELSDRFLARRIAVRSVDKRVDFHSYNTKDNPVTEMVSA